MAEVVLKVVNGWAVFPASPQSVTGASRFSIEFPANLREDQGARHLIGTDSQNGYELPTRNLLEKVLRSGDLFIDVGAHWGFFTLQAATHPAGDVRVIAFEPDPANASILSRNITTNGVADVAQLVCAACGDGFDIAPLVSNTSMGHSIRGVGLKPPFGRGPSKWVPVVSLDTALTYFPHAADRRVIIKIDAEGYEPQIIAGARSLLDTGRVALMVWERGHGLTDGAERVAMIAMMTALRQRGYRHFRPPDQQLDGAPRPFHEDDPYIGNVFSFGAGLAI